MEGEGVYAGHQSTLFLCGPKRGQGETVAVICLAVSLVSVIVDMHRIVRLRAPGRMATFCNHRDAPRGYGRWLKCGRVDS